MSTSVTDAVASRFSCRAFLPDKVSHLSVVCYLPSIFEYLLPAAFCAVW
jgi:hypothetical protein